MFVVLVGEASACSATGPAAAACQHFFVAVEDSEAPGTETGGAFSETSHVVLNVGDSVELAAIGYDEPSAKYGCITIGEIQAQWMIVDSTIANFDAGTPQFMKADSAIAPLDVGPTYLSPTLHGVAPGTTQVIVRGTASPDLNARDTVLVTVQ